MLLYSIEEANRAGHSLRKILHLGGTADLSQKAKLHSILLDLLTSSDHIVIDFNKVSTFDGSFIDLLCSVHQTTKFLHKTLEIQRNESGAFCSAFEQTQCPKSAYCLIENCFLMKKDLESIPNTTKT